MPVRRCAGVPACSPATAIACAQPSAQQQGACDEMAVRFSSVSVCVAATRVALALALRNRAPQRACAYNSYGCALTFMRHYPAEVWFGTTGRSDVGASRPDIG